jgi:beta-phosphoglucomutase
MLGLVIFDFDGVLADSERAHFETICNTLVENELSLDWAAYCEKYLGYDDAECFTAILKNQGQKPGEALIKALCQRKRELFAQRLGERSVLFEGVEELLLKLREAKIPCSIYSGSTRPEIDFILGQENLAGYFIDIVTAENVTCGKPDPEGYLLSLKQTNQILNGQADITADQCVVIEDSMWGITAAKEAGMKCLALETSYPAKMLTEADLVVKDLGHVNVPILKCLSPP